MCANTGARTRVRWNFSSDPLVAGVSRARLLPSSPHCNCESETNMASKKPSNEQTSARVASTASKLLRNPKTPASVKSVAASALTQRPNTGKSKK